MKKRTFLVFGFSGDMVLVFTDYSGEYALIAEITLERWTKVFPDHLEIMEYPSWSDNEKLLHLSTLWRSISPEIGGYLFGDTEESNPDPRNSLTCTCADSISNCPRHD